MQDSKRAIVINSIQGQMEGERILSIWFLRALLYHDGGLPVPLAWMYLTSIGVKTGQASVLIHSLASLFSTCMCVLIYSGDKCSQIHLLSQIALLCLENDMLIAIAAHPSDTSASLPVIIGLVTESKDHSRPCTRHSRHESLTGLLYTSVLFPLQKKN